MSAPASLSARPAVDSASADSGDRAAGGRAPLLLAATAFVVYGGYALLQFWQREGNWDSAVLGQAVAGYAELAAPVAPALGPGANQLGDHFSPVLALLAPLYAIAPHTLTLQLAQVVLVAASVFVITRAAARHLGDRIGVALGAAYAISFGVQAGVDQGFHELAFATLLLAVVGDLYLQGRYRAAAWAALPLLLVKEDMGFVVAALAVVLFLRGARRPALWLGATAVAYVPLVFLAAIPAANPRDRYDFTAMAVDSSDGTLAGIGQLVADMTDPVRWIALLLTLVVTAFACCRSPFMLLAVPILLERIAAPWEYYWGPLGHYNLPVMTIAFVAAIEGMAAWRRSRLEPLARVAPRLPLVSLAIAVGLLPAFALGQVVGSAALGRPAEAVAIERMTTLVEPGSTVQADRSLAAFLFSDTTTYTLEVPGAPRATGGAPSVRYIAIDRRTWQHEAVDPVAYAQRQHPGVAYTTILEQDGIVLLEREPR